MNELVFRGGRMAAVSEPVFLGRRPISLGRVVPVGVGDDSVWPSDLLAYRKQWDPFIAAHAALWRYLNALFESTEEGKQCPVGADPASLSVIKNSTMRAFCASLMVTRRRIDDSDAGNGIPAMWNAFAGKSSSDILSGAAPILKWYQTVVKSVSGEFKDELLKIAKFWGIEIQLPEVPSLSTQQAIIAKIEGAYIATKGVLQLAGYAAGTTLAWVATQAQGIVEGLTETVKAIPKVVEGIGHPATLIGIAAVVAVVGAGLIIYYVPHSPKRA